MKNIESKIYRRIEKLEENTKYFKDDLNEIKKLSIIIAGKNEILNINIEKLNLEYEKIENKIDENFLKNIKEQENFKKTSIDFELNFNEKILEIEKKIFEYKNYHNLNLNFIYFFIFIFL